MEIQCTRTGCPRPQNFFADLDDNAILKTVQQKYCITCGMPLILVGRYLPLRLLGRGGFGAAFLARDRYTPAMRRCVVKQFQPSGDLTLQQLQIAQNLFEREGEVLEQLGTHPQIPDLFAFFEISVPSLQGGKPDQFFYLVQEFIDGQNLEEELAQKGKLSENEVVAVLRELLSILKFVHENGSIHRDIKPSNIMRHQNGRLYLLDFGAVKKAAAGAAAARSTGIYSMGFAPPEQMSGGQVYPSTDLYALAVTCIELLTGKQPTELFDAYNNQWNWRNDAQVSAHLAAILDRMLLAAPNQRFQSAQEVLDALALNTKAPSPIPQVIPTPASTHVVAPSASASGNKGGMPVPQAPQPPQPPAVNPQTPSKSSFSTLELLSGAAFTGFEAGLLFIALRSLLNSPGISIGIWGMILGGLIFAQFRHIIEKFDLVIIAGITLAVIWFVPALHQGFDKQDLIVVSILAGASAIAVTALFRLIYKLLSNIL
ncbi:MAG: serine/threonine protein kinase [Aphanothece sp. CMT-3BRIN-NPC111]|jgi:serine/threonine-protein kinase|nr:serine/threonine protein kinase [Aphanothece sp. CMT-3BRIN-NPC111]